MKNKHGLSGRREGSPDVRLPAAGPPVEGDAPVLRAPGPGPPAALLPGRGRRRREIRRAARPGSRCLRGRRPVRRRRGGGGGGGVRVRRREELARDDGRRGRAAALLVGAPAEQVEPEEAPGAAGARGGRGRPGRRRVGGIEIQHHRLQLGPGRRSSSRAACPGLLLLLLLYQQPSSSGGGVGARWPWRRRAPQDEGGGATGREGDEWYRRRSHFCAKLLSRPTPSASAPERKMLRAHTRGNPCFLFFFFFPFLFFFLFALDYKFIMLMIHLGAEHISEEMLVASCNIIP